MGIKRRRATKKDLKKCLRLMKKWGERLDGVGWGVAGELCRCKEFKDTYAHLDYSNTAHTALLQLHQVDNHIERTALHEQLHLGLANMHFVVRELQWGGIIEGQREQAYKWYRYYEDDFVCEITKALLGMDKEIRHWKRRAKKLEKQLNG